jgi:hypothetical protein
MLISSKESPIFIGPTFPKIRLLMSSLLCYSIDKFSRGHNHMAESKQPTTPSDDVERAKTIEAELQANLYYRVRFFWHFDALASL